MEIELAKRDQKCEKTQRVFEAVVDISSPELDATVVNGSYSTRGHATVKSPASNTKRLPEVFEQKTQGLTGLPSALDLPARSQLLMPPIGQSARVRECLFLLVWVMALLFGNRYYERLQADNAKASAIALEQGAVRIALAANTAARHFRKESERASRALEGFGAVLDKALITADAYPIIFESGTSRPSSIYHDQLLLLDENRRGKGGINTPARAKPIDSRLRTTAGCLVPSRTSGEDQDQGGDRSRSVTAEEEGAALSLHMCPLSAAAGLIDAVKEKDTSANSNEQDGKSEAKDNLKDNRNGSDLQSILIDLRSRMRALREGVRDGEQTAKALSSKDGGKPSQRRVLLAARQGHEKDQDKTFANSRHNDLVPGKKRNFGDTSDVLGGQSALRGHNALSTAADESQPFVFRFYEHLPNTIVAPIDGFEVFLLKLYNTLPNPSARGGPPTRPQGAPDEVLIRAVSLPTFHGTVTAMFHAALEKLHRVDGRSKCTCGGGGDGDVDGDFIPENADAAHDDYERGDAADYYFEQTYARKPLFFSCDPRRRGRSSGGGETKYTANDKDQTCAMSAAARDEHRRLMAARYDAGRSRGRWRFGANNNPRMASSDNVPSEEKGDHQDAITTGAPSRGAAAAVRSGGTDDGLSSDVTASVVSPVAEAFIEAYYALYRYHQVVRRVKEVREVLEPLIHAIMRRNDTMLYNYI